MPASVYGAYDYSLPNVRRWNACVHRLDLGLYSLLGGGMEFEPMVLTPREKSPLPENVPRGGSNPRRCGQRAQALPTELFRSPYLCLIRYTFRAQAKIAIAFPLISLSLSENRARTHTHTHTHTHLLVVWFLLLLLFFLGGGVVFLLVCCLLLLLFRCFVFGWLVDCFC